MAERVWRVQLKNGEVWYVPFEEDPVEQFGDEIEDQSLGTWESDE
jgi:hypothetical protein